MTKTKKAGRKFNTKAKHVATAPSAPESGTHEFTEDREEQISESDGSSLDDDGETVMGSAPTEPAPEAEPVGTLPNWDAAVALIEAKELIPGLPQHTPTTGAYRDRTPEEDETEKAASAERRQRVIVPPTETKVALNAFFKAVRKSGMSSGQGFTLDEMQDYAKEKDFSALVFCSKQEVRRSEKANEIYITIAPWKSTAEEALPIVENQLTEAGLTFERQVESKPECLGILVLLA